jgi:hypothetical protein
MCRPGSGADGDLVPSGIDVFHRGGCGEVVIMAKFEVMEEEGLQEYVADAWW